MTDIVSPAAVRAETEELGLAGLARAQALYRRHLDQGPGILEFPLLGFFWEVHPGVFNPTLVPVTELFTRWLPYPAKGTFLEMGCGAGVTSVMAAKHGCQVTALDISAAAVVNARANVWRHNVADQVDVRLSDLFSNVQLGAKFDVIYWNSNFVDGHLAEGLPEQVTDLAGAFVDPDYGTHRRFLSAAGDYLAEDGCLIVGFANIGNWPMLRLLCIELGWQPIIRRAEKCPKADQRLEVQLVELCRA